MTLSETTLATVLADTLAPVLAAPAAELIASELITALEVARAGIAIHRQPPAWLCSVDQACAQIQKQLKPVLCARQIAKNLRADTLPKPLRPAAQLISSVALAELQQARQNFALWRESEPGLQCRATIQQALKRGKKKPLTLTEAQVDERLQRCARGVEKSQQQVLRQADKRNLKKQGKAAKKQALTQRFIERLGHEKAEASASLEVDVACFYALMVQWQTADWLKKWLQKSPAENQQGAAIGALWLQAHTERRRIEREAFMAAAPTRTPVYTQKTTHTSVAHRGRPNLPLRMRFGAVNTR